MKKVRTWLNDKGVQDILVHNNKLEAMEQEIMTRRLSEIQASFFQQFGVEGSFELKAVQTRPSQSGNRIAFRIVASNAQTQAILRQNPGWLGQFSN